MKYGFNLTVVLYHLNYLISYLFGIIGKYVMIGKYVIIGKIKIVYVYINFFFTYFICII